MRQNETESKLIAKLNELLHAGNQCNPDRVCVIEYVYLLEAASYDPEIIEHFPQLGARLMNAIRHRSVEVDYPWVSDVEKTTVIAFAPGRESFSIKEIQRQLLTDDLSSLQIPEVELQYLAKLAEMRRQCVSKKDEAALCVAIFDRIWNSTLLAIEQHRQLLWDLTVRAFGESTTCAEDNAYEATSS